MFVELDELQFGDDDDEWAWQEKARWIKFEEDVEEDAARWGKPHVSSLSFHSLLELRRCIEQGVVILDLDAADLPTIATYVVDQLVLSEQLPPDCRGLVLNALLLKHRHMPDQQQQTSLRKNLTYLNLFGLHKSASRVPPLKEHLSSPLFGHGCNDNFSAQLGNGSDVDAAKRPTHASFSPAAFSDGRLENGKRVEPDGKKPVALSDGAARSALRPNLSSPGSLQAASRPHSDSRIYHRIPTGAEATNVLVGCVDFLDAPIMAFVRLRDARRLDSLTEVPLPVRFLFVLLGPAPGRGGFDYHEIGRSICTLMADERFHNAAYVADSRRDILESINEFLHDSIVLPPGDYDKKTLMPVIDMARRQSDFKTRDRKTKTQRVHDDATADPSDDPLRRTGRLFGGLVNDVRRRFPHYVSDVTDAANLQCISATVFIYFACLAPAITFGGLLGDKTDKLMGVTEMLVATSICGVIFALLSGQPLTILGPTGPILVFEEALYKICHVMDIEFLAFRCWVGLWIGVIVTIVIMVEGSFLVRYVSRFTEEIFALLISLIFIYEVIKKLNYIFLRHPLHEYYPLPVWPCSDGNETATADGNLTRSWVAADQTAITRSTNATSSFAAAAAAEVAIKSDCIPSNQDGGHPNTALLFLILTFGTFMLAYALKLFRNSRFLGRSARRAIGDFGMPISIVVMVLVDFLIPETYSEKLDVPDGIRPTAPEKRAWLVNPFGSRDPLPIWAAFAAIVPACLVFIILFMETQITSMIVNKKDRRLAKSSGYHLDLFLVGILTLPCVLLGVPLMCSATVRTVTHVAALSVFSRTHAPGEKPRLISVIEQRMSALTVHVMIGVSALMGPVLRQIPLAVLFGIFLYLGFASMSGVQLVRRLKLMFMPVKHHPEDVGYVRRVRLWKMNAFTVIQLLCLTALWVVKSTKAALAFPLVLTLMIPVRLFLLPVLFTEQELAELDCEEESGIHSDDDEPDFYEQSHMPV